MYDAFGLKVGMPRSEGAGTSTTGNVCRKAFSNPGLLSEVLGIDENLIIRFSNILFTINCNNSIDPRAVASQTGTRCEVEKFRPIHPTFIFIIEYYTFTHKSNFNVRNTTFSIILSIKKNKKQIKFLAQAEGYLGEFTFI